MTFSPTWKSTLTSLSTHDSWWVVCGRSLAEGRILANRTSGGQTWNRRSASPSGATRTRARGDAGVVERPERTAHHVLHLLPLDLARKALAHRGRVLVDVYGQVVLTRGVSFHSHAVHPVAREQFGPVALLDAANGRVAP